MRSIVDLEDELDARDPQADSWLIDFGIILAFAMIAALVIGTILNTDRLLDRLEEAVSTARLVAEPDHLFRSCGRQWRESQRVYRRAR
jgi:hypothetical protein